MKLKAISYFFLLIFSAQSLGNIFLYADYYLNKKDYLVRCVNKNRPQLKCNGQCLLMKKIRAKEQKDQDDAEKRMEYKVEVLDCNLNEIEVALTTSGLAEKSYSNFIPGLLQDRTSSLFRPPSV